MPSSSSGFLGRIRLSRFFDPLALIDMENPCTTTQSTQPVSTTDLKMMEDLPMKHVHLLAMLLIIFVIAPVHAQDQKEVDGHPDRYVCVVKDMLKFCEPEKGFWIKVLLLPGAMLLGFIILLR